ncbi:MAG TPA: vWA domain-containing protein [Vicinamibacterales bacterium]|nr:vWA domain-containing protein [Vicinamibacterales bacterium]
MPPASDLLIALRTTWDEWMRTRWSDLQFGQAQTALLVFVVMLAIVVLLLLIGILRQRGGRTRVALPAILSVMRHSPVAAVRHLPLILFLGGIPLFAIALADPQTGFAREEVSYPGRRIALLVDASTSMVIRFESGAKRGGEATFFTAVAAAEQFIRRRMDGPYRDLVALIQFGNYAYVVTPFTNDYENILLSTRLIGDPREWGRFPDWGTTIIEGIDQATQLFKTFDFVNASGNLMIVLTDGRDSQLNQQAGALDRIVEETRRWKIPVYMMRTAYNRREGEVLQDKTWRATVERTGGRFYAAYDDESITRALRDIDRLSPGRIETREYSVARPRYAGYTLIAVGMWLTAALLKLGFGVFRTFP